ncbi:MAG: Gfo/Idh/MocA family oxidoreductase, partial [Bacteroidales bacterium]|nr:Gfo/Idh/MocA family oxidoreductase [Bacteroidales bacterium]
MQRGIKFHSWVVLLAGLLLVSCTGKASFSGSEEKAGTGIQPIRTEVPERATGQTHVLGLTAPKLDTVRVGFIGLGMRGPGAVERFTHIPGVKIVALCDKHADRVERSQQILDKAGFPLAASYSGSADAWKELCQRDDIDLVYIVTDWQHHAEMMLYAMEQGKHVACEVPAAMTLEEIWKVVDTAERTRKHCMMLENCVYDFFELTTLNMAR